MICSFLRGVFAETKLTANTHPAFLTHAQHCPEPAKHLLHAQHCPEPAKYLLHWHFVLWPDILLRVCENPTFAPHLTHKTNALATKKPSNQLCLAHASHRYEKRLCAACKPNHFRSGGFCISCRRSSVEDMTQVSFMFAVMANLLLFISPTFVLYWSMKTFIILGQLFALTGSLGESAAPIWLQDVLTAFQVFNLDVRFTMPGCEGTDASVVATFWANIRLCLRYMSPGLLGLFIFLLSLVTLRCVIRHPWLSRHPDVFRSPLMLFRSRGMRMITNAELREQDVKRKWQNRRRASADISVGPVASLGLHPERWSLGIDRQTIDSTSRYMRYRMVCATGVLISSLMSPTHTVCRSWPRSSLTNAPCGLMQATHTLACPAHYV